MGKSVSLRTRARAHFCAPAGWTERAEVVDYKPTCSELGALVLENRLIKQWRPPGNVKLKRADGYVYIRCRLDIAYPVLEVAPEPAPGRAVNVGPMRGRAAAEELVDQLQSLFGLRHCGRALPAARPPVGLRPDGPLRVALPRRPRPEPLPPPARRGARRRSTAPATRGEALLARIDEQMREAAAERRYERAAVLLRRRERLEGCSGGSPGCSSRPCALAARARPPPGQGALGRVLDRRAAASSTGARCRRTAELEARTERARWSGRRGRTGRAPEEVDEIRIVQAGSRPTSRRAGARAGAERARADALRRRGYVGAGARSAACFRFASDCSSHERMRRRPATAASTVLPMLFGSIEK